MGDGDGSAVLRELNLFFLLTLLYAEKPHYEKCAFYYATIYY